MLIEIISIVIAIIIALFPYIMQILPKKTVIENSRKHNIDSVSIIQ